MELGSQMVSGKFFFSPSLERGHNYFWKTCLIALFFLEEAEINKAAEVWEDNLVDIIGCGLCLKQISIQLDLQECTDGR